MSDRSTYLEPESTDLEACQGFATLLPRYLGCSKQMQSLVADLVEAFRDSGIGDEERERVLRALWVTLWQGEATASGGQKPGVSHPIMPDESLSRKQLEQEEQALVANLQRLMEERRLTQAQLAERAGLSEPAISMLLARKYRPQRRTMRLLAQVLGVSEKELAPEPPSMEKECSTNGAQTASAPHGTGTG
jgi:DNA-binding XRE family transcriptional regulator